MKQKTITKFVSHLENQKASKISKKEYCVKHALSSDYFSSTLRNIKKHFSEDDEDYKEILNLYNNNQPKTVSISDNNIEEELSKVDVIEDSEGKIVEYRFNIKIKDKPSLIGKFSRDEMNMIYRLYSSYGSKLTQREVSRFFPEFNLYDFRRILRAFSITKASAQFAPHVIRENTEEQLLEMAYREKENSFLTTLEAEENRKNANLVKDYFSQIQKLKSKNDRIDKIVEDFFKIKLDNPRIKIYPNNFDKVGIFHLADLHVGAKVEPESLYQNEFNVDVLKSRLNNLCTEIISKDFDYVVINLLGDLLDGMDNQTCRRDHILPQNMNNFEQVNNFLMVMDEFFVKLKTHYDPKKIQVYSVSHGNHK